MRRMSTWRDWVALFALASLLSWFVFLLIEMSEQLGSEGAARRETRDRLIIECRSLGGLPILSADETRLERCER